MLYLVVGNLTNPHWHLVSSSEVVGNLVKTLASNKLYCSELSSALKAHRQDPTSFYSGILQSTAKEFTRRQGEALAGIWGSLKKRSIPGQDIHPVHQVRWSGFGGAQIRRSPMNDQDV
jgi:hypothetical protein